jgi:hypothetical protein
MNSQSRFPLRKTHWPGAGQIATIFLLLLIVGLSGRAENITTKSGKTYENVTNIVSIGNGISFSYTLPGGTYRAKVLFSDLPDEVKSKYYDPFEEGLANARLNRPISLTLNSALRLSNLEVARQRAAREHKPLGFIMVWDVMFGGASYPMDWGANNDLAHFYVAFNNSLVLVFVRHEDELDKVPASVKKGFFGPDEGGHAPNMAVVTEDASEFICEIPLGMGANGKSTGATREPVFRAKIQEIKKFLASRKSAPPAAPK